LKDLAATVLATEKYLLAQGNTLPWLIEFQVPTDPPTRYRFTNSNQAVSRGTSSGGVQLVYPPYPVEIGVFRETNKGDLTDLSVVVANVTLEMRATLELYNGLVGQPMAIHLVSSLAPTDPNADIVYQGVVSHTLATAEKVTFTVGASNLTKKMCPKHRFNAHHCRWRYGGPECGYVIPATPGNTIGTGFGTCGHTLEACETRGLDEVARGLASKHPLRFGAFPGIAQPPVTTPV
jgi:lambda family phage minor tail protein L